MPLHNHILLNGRVNNPPRDIEKTNQWMRELVQAIDMKIIQGPFSSYVDKPGNRGLTSTVMIETSHIAFHVWDEEDPALLQFDLYTCSTLPVPTVLKWIDEFMSFKSYTYLVFERESGFNVVDAGKR